MTGVTLGKDVRWQGSEAFAVALPSTRTHGMIMILLDGGMRQQWSFLC